MVDLPDTIVDLPYTMVALPNTMVDMPNTMVHLHNTMEDPDPEKTNSMNSVEFNFLNDFPPNLLIFPPNLDP